MKNIFRSLKLFIGIIAVLIFVAGVALTLLGAYDLVLAFSHIGADEHHELAKTFGVGLLKAVDIFLIAIVFFVLSLGIMLLFNTKDTVFPSTLPEWLRIKSFMELKLILWEAILTTFVVSYLAVMAEKGISGEAFDVTALIMPGAIFLIALSLFVLKKGEH